MRYLTVPLLIGAGLALASCETVSDWIGEGREVAGKGAAAAVEAECSLSAGQRAENLAAVNNSLAERGVAHRVLSLDCDGDGAPDTL
jgi:hypothetical protein